MRENFNSRVVVVCTHKRVRKHEDGVRCFKERWYDEVQIPPPHRQTDRKRAPLGCSYIYYLLVDDSLFSEECS